MTLQFLTGLVVDSDQLKLIDGSVNKKHGSWLRDMIVHGASDDALKGDYVWDHSLSNEENQMRHLEQNYRRVGGVKYSDQDDYSNLFVAKEASSAIYDIQFFPQHNVEGLYIPSHRSEFVYRAVEAIPFSARSDREIFDQTVNSVRSRSLYQLSHDLRPPSYYMKETVVSWAILGFGNEIVAADNGKARAFKAFEQVMSEVLPPTLGFRSLQVRPPEVVLDTDTGEFMLDSVSGGIGS